MCAIVCGSMHIHLIYDMKCVGIVHTHKLGQREFRDFQGVLWYILKVLKSTLQV